MVKFLSALLTALCGGALLLLAGVPIPGLESDRNGVQRELQSLRSNYQVVRDAWQAERAARLGQEDRQREADAKRDSLAAELVALRAANEVLRQQAARFAPAAMRVDQLETEFSQLIELSGQRTAELEASLASQSAELAASKLGVESLQADVRATAAALATQPLRKQYALQNDVLSPVFQLSGGDAVGSAVLIAKEEDEAGHYYLALSCYHVVRDILETRPDVENLSKEYFQALFTDLGATERSYVARMIQWDVPSDLALLRIETDADLGPLARIAPLARANELGIFSEIYTVGCPLGTAAQATSGQITREQWEIDGESYWMVSSPAYFGNSGGGVFAGDTRELVGIFAKIYTHGSYRPQVITHMGLAIPLVRLHSWLDEIGYARLLPASETLVREAAAAQH